MTTAGGALALQLQRTDAARWASALRQRRTSLPTSAGEPTAAAAKMAALQFGWRIRVRRVSEVRVASLWVYFSQPILISLSIALNSGSPVTSSAFFCLANAAAKASARDIL